MLPRFVAALSKTAVVCAGTAAMIAACASAPPPTIASSSTAPRASTSASTNPAASALGPPPSASPPLTAMLLPGVGMSTSKPKGGPIEDEEDLVGPAAGPAFCGKDEDCWSRTCCPATQPEDCVHASRARKCAIVDIQCKPSPMHFTCFCQDGACKGRLAPP